jgi:hypothetical protein
MPTYLQVKVASVRSNEIDRMNRPELDYNREVREDNHAVETFFDQMLCHGHKTAVADFSWVKETLLGDELREQVPLKHVLSDEDREIIRREAETQAALRERTPEDWRARIDAIPQQFRLALANIVWWDFFSEREKNEAWPHLDVYVDGFWNRAHANDAPGAVIRQYLAELGYTPYSVETRLLGAETSN